MQEQDRTSDSQGPFEQKPITNLGEKGAWVGVSRDCPFFEYPLLPQEWVKLRTSQIMYAHS